MFNIAVGEVIWGGVGSGLYGMLFFCVVLAVFIGGLMVGRTPEHLGKKIRASQVKLVVIAILVPFLVVLGFTALAVVLPAGLAGRLNAGPHGFSEIFYGYLSQGSNNGSALLELTASSPFYAITEEYHAGGSLRPPGCSARPGWKRGSRKNGSVHSRHAPHRYGALRWSP